MGLISISPGHWAVGTGASGLIDEVTENRKVAKKVTEILKKAGIGVNYIEDITSKNQSQNIGYLVNQHNKSTRKLDVSIHFNASAGTQSRGIGTEVLYFDAKDLAAKVSKAIASASGLIDRGAKQRKELSFLAKTSKPAILIEVCFVNSSVDVALYKRDFEKICKAIAQEIASYVGGSVASNTSTTTASAPSVSASPKASNSLTATGKKELKELFTKAYSSEIFSEDHSKKVDTMSDGEAVSLIAAFVNRTSK